MPGMSGMDKKYLGELEQVLTAEAALLREGTDLLADPEYRALREMFVDGELSLTQFAERVENLAETRPELVERDMEKPGEGPDDGDEGDDSLDPEDGADADGGDAAD